MIATEHKVEQRSPEWFKLKTGTPSASEMSKVLSKGRGSTPSVTKAKYLREKAMEQLTGKYTEKSFSSEYMNDGTKYEPYALKVLEKLTGLKFREAGIYIHNELNVGASPDGVCVSNPKIGAEIKVPKKENLLAAIRSNGEEASIKKQYRDQMTTQTWLCEFDKIAFFLFNPELFVDPATRHLSMSLTWVYRDEDRIEALEDSVIDFLDDMKEEVAFLKNYQSNK